MTLMTVIYGLILDEGMRRYLVGSLTLSTKPDEPDAQSRKSYSCAVLEPIIWVGFSQIG